MDYTVKLLPIAYADLQKAKLWYKQQSSTLGEDFKKEVNREIDYIKKHPTNYQIKYRILRQSLVPRFPYAIFYLIEESTKQIVIFGLLHTSRNPKSFKKGLPKRFINEIHKKPRCTCIGAFAFTV